MKTKATGYCGCPQHSNVNIGGIDAPLYKLKCPLFTELGIHTLGISSFKVKRLYSG